MTLDILFNTLCDAVAWLFAPRNKGVKMITSYCLLHYPAAHFLAIMESLTPDNAPDRILSHTPGLSDCLAAMCVSDFHPELYTWLPYFERPLWTPMLLLAAYVSASIAFWLTIKTARWILPEIPEIKPAAEGDYIGLVALGAQMVAVNVGMIIIGVPALVFVGCYFALGAILPDNPAEVMALSECLAIWSGGMLVLAIRRWTRQHSRPHEI